MTPATWILIAIAVWILGGPLIHWMFYAHRQGDYDPLGFVLAALIGPVFTTWALWREER